MRCPSCNSLDTQVKDSRPTEDSAVIRRRRVCMACNFRFTTFERVQLRELTVIKRNGRRVPFDRDKLVRSLQISLRKRPVDPERVEKMVSAIVRELESGGEAEISSETIGEIVMEHLRQLDDVAYVRFASVYRNFREAKDFETVLGELSGDDDRPGARYANDLPHSGRSIRRKIQSVESRRPALHGAGAGAGPARAGPHLAQSRRRRRDRQGRRHCRPRLDAARRASACRGRGAQARRRGRARGHAVCDAGAVLASRQIAALRRCGDCRRHRARGVGDRGSQSGSGGAGPCAAARGRDRGRCGLRRCRGGARPRRTFPPYPRQAPACDPEAGGLVGRQDRRGRAASRSPSSGEAAKIARASAARAMRRHPGRDRHRAGGRPAADLPAAGHGGAIAGAGGAGPRACGFPAPAGWCIRRARRRCG